MAIEVNHSNMLDMVLWHSAIISKLLTLIDAGKIELKVTQSLKHEHFSSRDLSMCDQLHKHLQSIQIWLRDDWIPTDKLGTLKISERKLEQISENLLKIYLELRRSIQVL